MPIDATKVQWDTPDPAAIKWDEPAPVAVAPSTLDKAKQAAGNTAAGLVRGAGSIGATLLYPWDKAQDLYYGDRDKKLSDLIKQQELGAGYKPPMSRNEERRAGMDGGLEAMGADPNSAFYKGGKLVSEVAGTMGAGGAAANILTRVAPNVASAAPALVEALRTGGMSANGAGIGTRMAGGAANGALSAGLVNPEDAGTGAVIGAAAPVVVKAAGAVGEKIGDKLTERLAEQLRKYQANAPMNKTIEQSVDAGYVIPPATVNPTFGNRVLESISGKQATQQLASEKNTEVTGKLVREALGLPADAPLSQGTLENLRKTAGKAYGEVSAISPEAAADLEALKAARNESQAWFKAYNRSAHPDDLAKAKQFRLQSDQLEQALESYATNAGKPELVPALRDARTQIAKSYTVGRAVNDAAGTVDARVLGRMYEKGAPLTDELETVGRFASAFPTVAKTPQQIGSPDAHNLKTMASLLLGSGGAGTGAAAGLGAIGTGGAALAAGAIPMVAPALARSMMFRQGAQRGLIPTAPTGGQMAQLAALLRDPQVQQLFLKSAPTIGSSIEP